jgi:signal transduction histidine kinase
MNGAAPERKEAVARAADFAEEYRAALEQYISESDEAALGRGYELGRRALAEGKSLMEMAAIHHQALREVFLHGQRDIAEFREQALQASADFLTESLSPYEMAHRGFQDAVAALRQMNDRFEEQIKGIAYAVHDEAGQLLVAVHLALANLATQLPDERRAQIVEIEALLNSVEKQLRQYSHELRPTVLDDLGWLPAIRFLAESVSKRANIPIHVDARVTVRLPGQAETAIYRVVQEAINNAVKHAQARDIWIGVAREGGNLSCCVRDNGVGFDVSALRAQRQRRGLGLTAMNERLNAVGGSVTIESAPGKGTELRISLPMEKS